MRGEFRYVYGRDINILHSIKVAEVMKPQITAVSESTRLSDLIEMISESNATAFPVIKHDGTLAGTISYGDVRQVAIGEDVKAMLEILVVKDISNPTNLNVLEDDDLSSAMKLMLDAGIPSVPVVIEGNRLVGMLYVNDAIQAYKKKLLLSEVGI